MRSLLNRSVPLPGGESGRDGNAAQNDRAAFEKVCSIVCNQAANVGNQPDIIANFRSLAVKGALPPEVRSAVMESIYQNQQQRSRKGFERELGSSEVACERISLPHVA